LSDEGRRAAEPGNSLVATAHLKRQKVASCEDFLRGALQIALKNIEAIGAGVVARQPELLNGSIELDKHARTIGTLYLRLLLASWFSATRTRRQHQAGTL
jgi:hypothetical protein